METASSPLAASTSDTLPSASAIGSWSSQLVHYVIAYLSLYNRCPARQ
jgi:hypothetical protein